MFDVFPEFLQWERLISELIFNSFVTIIQLWKTYLIINLKENKFSYPHKKIEICNETSLKLNHNQSLFQNVNYFSYHRHYLSCWVFLTFSAFSSIICPVSINLLCGIFTEQTIFCPSKFTIHSVDKKLVTRSWTAYGLASSGEQNKNAGSAICHNLGFRYRRAR